LAPWSIYSFPPADCAALICDLLMFETVTADQTLVESFERAGLLGEILLTRLMASWPERRASSVPTSASGH
jgi:hypothetical protein